MSLPRAIQAVILFSTVFGAAFLYEVHPLLDAAIFDSVAFGWFLFVLDSVLTFVRPRLSFYLGLVLAAVALVSTLSSPAHFQFIENGDVPATATLFVGWGAEILLIALVVLFIVRSRRKDEWSWPGRSD